MCDKENYRLQAENDESAFSSTMPYSESTFLNFTSMHGIRTIVSKIKRLTRTHVSGSQRPPLSYFQKAAELEDPSAELDCRELPFAAYLITGNAGSGKSTCLQTLSEAMDCVMTGTTKVAAQNVYTKLSSAYASQHVNTIFHEFGFRGNHVQAVLGKWQYHCQANPPGLAELQKRDLTYYWEVISDITKNKLHAAESEKIADAFVAARAAEDALGRPRGSLARWAFCAHGGIPAFARTNVIVVDEAGLLGRYILTAVVYSWWLTNAVYNTPQYAAGLRPVIVCVGSPTQTSSLESTFEHSRLKCNVKTSENVLTFVICNRSLRTYLELPRNWSIFVNNKRCTEPEFGDLLKCLEYGLPITEEHARMADSFVVPEAFINNPANLPGWTRLYSSHKEVSSYMARLHAYLKVSGDERFTVFTLPAYTLVRLSDFEEYRAAVGQPGLTLERWLSVNAGRLSNWSQSRDQDAVHARCEIRSSVGLAIACSDVTYVINSQVAVTTRLKKWVFGFCDTFEGFMAVLKDDSFVKTHGEGSVEYAYRFLAQVLFNGLINFYDFLLDPKLPAASVDAAYARLADVTRRIVPGMMASADPDGEKMGGDDFFSAPLACAVASGQEDRGAATCDAGVTDAVFDFSRASDAAAFTDGAEEREDDDDDVIFSALSDRAVDMLYCNYEFGRAETPSEVHAQFAMLKSLFLARYAALSETFGRRFCEARFDSYVENVTFKRGEMFAHGMRGGMLSMALQADSYTLVGHTRAKVHAFSDESLRRRLGDATSEVLQDLRMPLMVLKDQRGFMSVVNVNVNEFVESVDDKELKMAVTADYGLSSKLSMTIARSQGLSLDKVAICFPRSGLRLNTVYVAMSRVVSSEYLRTNINPLRENYTRDDSISEHILSALRDPDVHIVY